MAYIIGYFNALLNLFHEMAVYLLLGMAIAGVLRVFFSDSFIIKHLGGKKLKNSLMASLFGVPLPLCSCGVIPTGISLYKRGASLGSTISFLTSTPQTGIDSVLVTYGFFGWPLALFKLVSAFITGTFGGIIGNFFDHQPPRSIDANQHQVSQIKTFKGFITYSFVELVSTLRKWLILGILIAAALSYFLPDNLIASLGINNQWLVYLLTLLIAVPMYVCATASVPIAAVLLGKGITIGSVIIFLMAGPATNIATITVLWKILGRKATIIYLVNITLGSLLFAFLFDQFASTLMMVASPLPQHEHAGHSWIQILGSITLAGLLIYSYIQEILPKFKKTIGRHEVSFQLSGISCNGCVISVKNKLAEFPFIEQVDLNTSGTCKLYLTQEIDLKDAFARLEESGYKVVEDA